MGGKGKESSSSSKRDWSDPRYDKKSQRYFRTSTDKKGKTLYHWETAPNAIATGDEDFDDDGAEGVGAGADGEYFDNQPRSLRDPRHHDAGVDGLTDAMGAHNISRSPKDHEYTHLAQGSNYHAYDESEAGPSDTTGAYGMNPAWPGQNDPNNFDERDYDDGDYDDGDYDPEGEYYGDDPDYYQPQQSGTGNNYEDTAANYYPTTNKSNREKMLDSRFQIHHSQDFTAGSIIKLWWSEGKGHGRTVTSKSFPIGDLVHSRARRFLVIRPPADGTSLIVPIATYNDRGCTKSGSKARNHGIIHDAREPPMLLQGEPTLGYQPVRANMTEPSETLTLSSRIDYSRLQSIQHNQPVWFLGDVDNYDLENVVYPALEDIWQRRRGSSGGGSHKSKHSHRDSGRKDDKDRKHRSSRRK